MIVFVKGNWTCYRSVAVPTLATVGTGVPFYLEEDASKWWRTFLRIYVSL